MALNYPLWLIGTYTSFFCFTLTAFVLATRKVLISLAISIATIIVASEFWEIPILVYGYLHLFGHPHSGPHAIHHLLVIILFALLLKISKFKATRENMLWFIAIIILNFVFLTPPLSKTYGVLARPLGLMMFTMGVYSGCSLVGPQS